MILSHSSKVTLHACLNSWPRFVPNMEYVSIALKKQKKKKEKKNLMQIYHRMNVSKSP